MTIALNYDVENEFIIDTSRQLNEETQLKNDDCVVVERQKLVKPGRLALEILVHGQLIYTKLIWGAQLQRTLCERTTQKYIIRQHLLCQLSENYYLHQRSARAMGAAQNSIVHLQNSMCPFRPMGLEPGW